MELNPQFRDFLAAIRPTDRQKEDWKSGAATLRARLANDETLGALVVATFLQGSVRRATAIRPTNDKRPDVDIVVVTNIDHHNSTPEAAMSKFVPFLDKYYASKWKWQGRSFGIELSYVDLDLVITALPSDQASRAIMEKLYRSQAVLSSETLEDQGNWRLNESWSPQSNTMLGGVLGETRIKDAPADQWQPHPLWLPDRDVGNWGRTHPLAQIQWTAAKNRACNGHYVNLVRAMKWWKLTNAADLPKYPKGYPLEHMIGHVLPDGTTSIAQGVVAILEGIRDIWAVYAQVPMTPTLNDHGVPEHDVLKRLSAVDFAAFHKAAATAAEEARAALACTDSQESGELWRTLFGPKFPLPGPQGGDRPRGFAAPTKPAEPRKERFA
jgi:hypothetical protein